jgi:PAS domain S-box-containing protein
VGPSTYDAKEGEWSARKLRALVDAAPDSIAVTNREGRIILVNAQLEKQFGYGRGELLGLSVEKLVPERFRSKHVSHRTDYFNRPRLRPMGLGLDLHARRKDGAEFPVDIFLIPLDIDGETLVCSAIRDITERRRIDDALRQSEERFRVALKNSPVVVFNQDLWLRYTWINVPILVWAKRDWLGHTDAEIVGGEEGARLTAIKQAVLDTGVGSRTEVTVTFDGEAHYFDLTVEPLRDGRGALIGITCACSDVTLLVQAAAERDRLIAELQDALAKVKLLSGLLPICSSCKQIRDENGDWRPVESYISRHSEAQFSHGVCPECYQKLYGEYFSEP